MKPHKHAELIKAWADGAEIEIELLIGKELKPEWHEDDCPMWHEDRRYRIKPEPKPDVDLYAQVGHTKEHPAGLYAWISCAYSKLRSNLCVANLKLTFDGETGELKSAEVLKGKENV